MIGMFALFMIICTTSILCFFSQEFQRVLKKIFAIKGTKLMLPLLLASTVVFVYEFLVVDLLLYIQDKLLNINILLNSILPQYKYTPDLILILLLTSVTLIPVGVLHYFSYRRTRRPYLHPYIVSTIVWIVASVLLVCLPRLYN